jgi:uncharacterized protein (DUF3084 family)
MSALENIENLVEHLIEKVEKLINEREKMMGEVLYLRAQLMERDEEAVKASRDMKTELESAKMNALRFEQEQARVEARLQNLNDRLLVLVDGHRRGG